MSTFTTILPGNFKEGIPDITARVKDMTLQFEGEIYFIKVDPHGKGLILHKVFKEGEEDANLTIQPSSANQIRFQ